MKKLMITVNGKRYEVDVEVVHDDEAIESQPAFRPPVRLAAAAPAAVAPAPTARPQAVAPPTAAGGPKGKSAPADKKSLTSPINGVILEIPVKEGDTVKQNDILFILEAMKMKTNISSPQNGKIKAIKVRTGDKIEAGQILLTFE
jgi:glutaconyl-CoA/methylmalonyl-CoA decarboxylase subunit gamma